MALQDILAAITAAADARIELARSEHHKQMTKMREESERSIAMRKQEILKQKEQKKALLKSKTETHAAVHKRNTLLSKKKELLDRLYAKITDGLTNLSENDVEPLLKACIDSITTEGEIHPSSKHEDILKKLCKGKNLTMATTIKASGGFIFISQKEEQDCTFENLVEHALRPKTELEASQQLFA